MAEVTGLRNNGLPYPVYGAPWGVVAPIFDADGDPITGATGLDSEVSKNGDTFADCTNEATEIATSSGVYYLLLTGAEMTADVVTVIIKTSTSGGKTTVLTFYPRKLVSLRAATAAGGAAGSITLDASANATDDYYNGCLVVGVLDATTEARIITDYTGSSKVAAVTPNWNVTPDSDDTFTIYLPEGRQIGQADLTNIAGALVSTTSAQLGVNAVNVGGTAQTGRDLGASVLISSGTGTGQLSVASGVIAADAVAISGDTVAADNAESYFDGTGYGDVLQRTTIATLASQTSFTLTAGSADNTAYAGCRIVIQDATTAAQKAQGNVGNYTGSTKTITLQADPGIFTMAVGDIVTILSIIDLAKISGANVSTTTAHFGVNVVNAGTVAWNSGSITASTIAANAITSSELADGAITAAKFAAGAIDATAIADGAIDAATLATGTITAAKFAAGAIDAAAIATDAIGAAEFSQAAADKVWGTTARTITAATNITSTGGTVPITAGGLVSADVTAISTGTAAADNAESYFDGTGFGDLLQRTTIATLASQTSFTLTAGSADNSAYIGCRIVVQDASTAAQKATGFISAYTGSTKTVTLAPDPAIFTMAIGDIVTILAAIDVYRWKGVVVQGSTGRPEVDVTRWVGTTVPAPGVTGVPKVDLTHVNAAAQTATLDTIKAQTAAIEVDTGTDIPAALVIIDDFLDTEVAAILAAVDTEIAAIIATIGVAGAGLTAADDAVLAAIAALNNLSQANIRTAVGLGSANLDTQLDALPTNAELATALGTADDAVLAAIAALNNITAGSAATAVLTTQMTESYAANGVAPTLAQALFAVHQLLMDFAISTTSLTVRKLNNVDTAFVATLDSATVPTSLVRT